MVSLELSNLLTTIADNTFSGCSKLQSVSIPRSVESICESAFMSCPALSSLTLPAYLTSIGNSAFQGCTSLGDVVFPDRLSSLGDRAFEGCSNLTTPSTFPSLRTIGTGSFKNCTSLTSIALPDAIKAIPDEFFDNCLSLTSFRLPSQLESVGNRAFFNCSSLPSLEFPATVSRIGSNAFNGCRTMSQLYLTNQALTINESAFANCGGLKYVELSGGLQTIPLECFRNGSGIETIVLGEKVERLEPLCFDGCNNVTLIRSLNPTPPSASTNSFSEAAYANATLKVPAAGSGDYSNAAVWKYFDKNSPIYPSIEYITVNPSALSGKNGQHGFLSINTYPSQAKYTAPRWTSSDPDIISITDAGEYTIGAKTGEATVTATVTDLENGRTFSGECKVTVTPTQATQLTLDRTSLSLCEYQTYTLSATVMPETTTEPITWSSSDPSIVSVSENGTVRALNIGQAVITARCGDLSATCTVSVSGSLSLDRQEVILSMSETATLTLTILNEELADKNIVWISSNENVATVKDGLITPHSVGECEITATVGTTGVSCHVIVSGMEITPAGPLTMRITETLQLSAKTYPESAVTWSAGDPAILTVDENGLVTALAAGNTWVKATDGYGKEVSVEINILPEPVASITPEKASLEILVGETVKANVVVKPEYATEKRLDWTSLNPEVASVDAFGNITALKEGTAEIRIATIDGSGISTSIMVSVISRQIIWDQTFRCEAGEKVALTAYYNDGNNSNIQYRCVQPDGGFCNVPITQEGDKWYATFQDAGPCMIEAYWPDTNSGSIRKNFNVVSEHDGLMYIDGLYYRYTDKNRNALMVVPGYEVYAGDYTVPASANGMPVTEIGRQAFYSCKSLGSVTIKNGITKIGYEAFGNSTLTSIHIPASVTVFDDYVFNALRGRLTDIYLYGMTPIAADGTTFNATTVYKSCVLHVPAGTLAAYRQAEVWKEFANITDDIVIPATGLVLDKTSLTLYVNNESTLKATVTPETTTDILVWSSSDTSIATVSKNGTVTALKSGKAVITATCGKMSASCAVSVIKGVSLSMENANLTLSGTAELTVTIHDSQLAGKNIVWTSSNENVATVKDGIVTPRTFGECDITATVGTTSVSCHVTVSGMQITPSGPFTMKITETLQLSVIAYPVSTITWAAGDPAIISVDENGLVTALAAGKTSVKATDGYGKESSVEINILPEPVASITPEKSSLEMHVGETANVNVVIKPEYATEKTLKWTSLNPEVASVDAYGNITALKEGTAEIQVEAVDGSGVSTSIMVSVILRQIIWDQTFRCEVGEKILLAAYSENNDNGNILYRCVQPDGGFRNVPITKEGDSWYATFPEAGPCIIEAYWADTDSGSVRKNFNVVTEHDGLMYIDGLYYRYTDTNQNALTVVYGYEVYTGDYTVPASANGLPVTEIGRQAFYSCKSLGSVTIENGIKKFGYEAFGNCSLTSIHIPASVTVLNNYVFNDLCGHLADIYLYRKTPIAADGTTFNVTYVYNSCVLHVPAGTLAAYRQAEVWKEFANIVDDLMIPTTGLVLDRTSLTLYENHESTLNAYVTPAIITDIVAWSSSDTSIAAISENGTVTALKPGTAVITATCGNLTASCSVTVLKGISLDIEDISLKLKDTAKLTVTIHDSRLAGKNIVWTSSNQYVATVKDGLITPRYVGECDITATIGTTSASCHVHVIGININPAGPFTMRINETKQLSASTYPESVITWTVGDPTILSVYENGMVIALATGKTWVKATNESGNEASVEISILPEPVASITPEKTSLKMHVGETTNVNVVIKPEYATEKTLKWTSLNPEVASVDAFGNITALKKGTAEILIESTDGSGISTSIMVSVIPRPIIWDQTFRCEVGEKVLLAAYSEDNGNILFRCVQPDGGFRNVPITKEGDSWYATFPEAGPCIIEAYWPDTNSGSVRKKFNVVSEHDGLMYIDGLYYRYTDKNRNALLVVPGYEVYAGDYTVPASVNGLPVTEIGDWAFYSCKSLGSVTIQNGITKIGTQAFGNSTLTSIHIPASVTVLDDHVFNALRGHLTDIYLYGMTPIAANGTTFNATTVYKSCVLHVPAGTLAAYRQAEVWKEFANIVDDLEPTSAITDVQDDYIGRGDIYNIRGILIKRNADSDDIRRLNPGIYIINGKKIMIK
ncbi:Ig-like domain-containing protein [Duncaniella sp.]|uniref:Ig-like domain-containing protein n=1 Tax=Duncaniella sp. TaxID=2518496 RepID=UPI0034487EB9